MTDLNKRVSRRTRAAFAHYRRRIIVSLEPGDVLGMRLERTRTTFLAPMADIYRVMAGWHAEAKRREKRKGKI